MIDSLLREELLKALDRLSPAMQHRALEFARELREAWVSGTPSSAVLRFAATLPAAEADEFLRSFETRRE
jgi:hypothetical protein